jgi:hypothetical protein
MFPGPLYAQPVLTYEVLESELMRYDNWANISTGCSLDSFECKFVILDLSYCFVSWRSQRKNTICKNHCRSHYTLIWKIFHFMFLYIFEVPKTIWNKDVCFNKACILCHETILFKSSFWVSCKHAVWCTDINEIEIRYIAFSYVP